MTTRIQKVGDALAVILPPAVADQPGFAADAEVDVTVENGAVVARPAGRTRYTLEEMLRQITPENLHPETDMGPPVGREIV